jgi:hypothetical protein
MTGLLITDRYKAGEFRSYRDWKNRAQRAIAGRSAICIDAQGRECWIGDQFRRAHEEGTFPVSYYFRECDREFLERHSG